MIQTDTELTTRATEIQNEVDELDNTALRVGSLFNDIILNKINIDYLDTDVTLAADSDAKLATQRAIKAYIDNILGARFIPPGMVDIFAGDIINIPTGWLLCDGRGVSRGTYANLFTTIGIIYGAGDGSATFNLPNIGKRVLVGYDSATAGYNVIGGTGGSNDINLTTAQIPAHWHYVASAANTTNLNDPFGPNDAVARWAPAEPSNAEYRLDNTAAVADIGKSSLTGTGASINIRNSYIVLPYIIKT